MKTELLARNAPRHGDAVTPLVLASASADTERHRAATAELVRLVLADPSHGDGNRVVLAGWLDTWTAESIRAAEALAPLFGAGASETIGSCLSRVLAGQLDLLSGLGLVGGVQASQADGRARAGRVGISLMLSAETEAAVELVREQMPDAAVAFRGPYCKVERDGELDFDMAKLGDRLGRDIDTETFLVSMSSYYGRIVVSDHHVTIHPEILPDHFRS
jgi:propane monooxygenase coupling protein